jgi:hypothetical protein
MLRKSMLMLVAVALVAIVAASVYGGSGVPTVLASRTAGIAGSGETGIQVQNLAADESATVGVDFYAGNGHLQQTIQLPPVAPAAAANIWLPGTDLPTGAYSAVAGSDHPVAAIARTDWPTSQGAAIYSSVKAALDVMLPLAVRHYYGQSSIVSIQNTDPNTAAEVSFDVLEVGLSSPVLSTHYTIPPRSSVTLDFEQDLEFQQLGDNFLGAAHAVATTNTKIGLMSFVDIRTSEKAVYAFEGVPVADASTVLYAPLFRALQYPRKFDPTSGRLDTGISVVNTADNPVDVHLTYTGSLDPTASDACRGNTFTGPTRTIPAGSSYVFYQGDPKSENLPVNCFGSAVIHATGPVLAIVNDAQNEGLTSAAYNAVAAGALTVALPLYRRQHAGGLSTGIQAQNLGDAAANVTLRFRKQNPDGSTTEVAGCGTDCQVQIAPGASYTWWPPNLNALEPNSFGSATLESDQPVAVIVNDALVTGERDMATYNGIGVTP